MTSTPVFDAQLEELGKASKKAALLGLIGFLSVVTAIGFAAVRVSQLQREQQRLQQSVRLLSAHSQELGQTIQKLETHSQELIQTQNGVLDFLGGVTSGDRIRLIDPSVNWLQTKSYLARLDAGPRKTAVLDALLLAWKDLPFSLNNRSLSSGIDSPHFINTVLSSMGITVEQKVDERLSDAMMRQFQTVASPLPGDLIFYHGNVGSFVLMYIGPGSSKGKGIAVGTLQTGEEVQVVDTENINTPVYPFIGYFRVPYH